jgi:hypothetical protein
MKGLFAGKSFPPTAWLATREALTRIKKAIADLKPLAGWVDEHVGSRH